MAKIRFTPLELSIMEALWNNGPVSIREIQESFPESDRPAYTTIQTVVYRLEEKQAVRRVKKISNAHIFQAVVERSDAQSGLMNELLSLFGGRSELIMSHLIQSGNLTLKDLKSAEEALRNSQKGERK